MLLGAIKGGLRVAMRRAKAAGAMGVSWWWMLGASGLSGSVGNGPGVLGRDGEGTDGGERALESSFTWVAKTTF